MWVPEITAGLALGLIAAGLAQRPIRTFLERFETSRVVAFVLSMLKALNRLRSPIVVLRHLLLSLLAWSAEAGLFIALAMGMSIQATWAAPWLGMALGNLAGLIPSSPGNAGTFDYFCREGILLAGGEMLRASQYTLVVHAIIWLALSLAGGAYLWSRGLDFRPTLATSTPLLEEEMQG